MGLLDKNGLCETCDPEFVKRVQKREELLIKDLLDENKVEYVNYNKAVEWSCTKERPDFVFDHKTHFVILEVDEHQHKAYDPQCEATRMGRVTMAFGGIPVFWVRYNPHAFVDHNNRKCEVTTVARHKHLLFWLRKLATRMPPPLKEETDKLVCEFEVLHLFYDKCAAQSTDMDIERRQFEST